MRLMIYVERDSYSIVVSLCVYILGHAWKNSSTIFHLTKWIDFIRLLSKKNYCHIHLLKRIFKFRV
jgi:hypothetical protein